MPLLSLKKADYVDGPHSTNIKITFENICERMNDERYSEGVDAATLVSTFSDIYDWLMGISKGKAIRLPAPSNDPYDRHLTIWPEGSVVKTRERRSSRVSDTSSVTSGGRKVQGLSRAYTSSRASTTTSSKYAPIRNNFIDDEEQLPGSFRRVNLADMPDRQQSMAPQPRSARPRTQSGVPPMDDVEGLYVPDQSGRHAGGRAQQRQKGVFAED